MPILAEFNKFTKLKMYFFRIKFYKLGFKGEGSGHFYPQLADNRSQVAKMWTNLCRFAFTYKDDFVNLKYDFEC